MSEREDPPLVGDERAMLEGWLDFHRATLLHKCEGLSGEQLAERSVMALRRVSGVYLENFFSGSLDSLHGRQGAMRRRPIT